MSNTVTITVRYTPNILYGVLSKYKYAEFVKVDGGYIQFPVKSYWR